MGLISAEFVFCSDIQAILHSDNLLRSSNVHLLRGIVNLGKLLQKNSDVKDCMSPEHVFHTQVSTECASNEFIYIIWYHYEKFHLEMIKLLLLSILLSKFFLSVYSIHFLRVS